MTGTSARRAEQLLHGAPLAEDDALRTLTVGERRQLGELWRRRSENELRTSLVFSQLDAELRSFGAPAEVLALSARAIDDEAFHAELCRLMAELYLGRHITLSIVAEPPPPTFPICSTRVQRALFAALHSSVNETLAITYLAACVAEAQSEPARRVLKAILSDEVRHARIGWAVLASPRLNPQDRETIAAFVPALLDACVGSWSADNELDYPDDLAPGHGCINHAGIARAVDAALTDIILPGLEHVGVDAAAARRWVSEKRG
jgi:hypothetical protein